MKKLFFILPFLLIGIFTFANNINSTSSLEESVSTFEKSQILSEEQNIIQTNLFKIGHICEDLGIHVTNTLASSFGYDLEEAIMVGEVVEGICCELLGSCP